MSEPADPIVLEAKFYGSGIDWIHRYFVNGEWRTDTYVIWNAETGEFDKCPPWDTETLEHMRRSFQFEWDQRSGMIGSLDD